MMSGYIYLYSLLEVFLFFSSFLGKIKGVEIQTSHKDPDKRENSRMPFAQDMKNGTASTIVDRLKY